MPGRHSRLPSSRRYLKRIPLDPSANSAPGQDRRLVGAATACCPHAPLLCGLTACTCPCWFLRLTGLLVFGPPGPPHWTNPPKADGTQPPPHSPAHNQDNKSRQSWTPQLPSHGLAVLLVHIVWLSLQLLFHVRSLLPLDYQGVGLVGGPWRTPKGSPVGSYCLWPGPIKLFVCFRLPRPLRIQRHILRTMQMPTHQRPQQHATCTPPSPSCWLTSSGFAYQLFSC